MDSLNFRQPEQHEPGVDAFDCRPHAVWQWANALPLGNMSESARQLHQVLHETNRLILPMEHRSALLEAIATPLHTVVQGFMHKLADQHLPLSHKALRLAEFLQQLLSEVVIGYQIVLDSKEQGSWLFRLSHHALWPLCIHRMLHYLGLLQQVQRLIHQPCPNGLWLAIHRLYLEAVRQGLQDKMLSPPWESEYHESIEQAYLQTLLFALIDPGLLTPAQLDLVRQRLPGWAMLASLLGPAQWHADLPAYWIRLDTDSPHTSPAAQTSARDLGQAPARLLDLSALHQSIQQGLAPGSEHYPNEPAAQTLEILARAWQVPTVAREPRNPGHLHHQTAIGISALFHLMRCENRHNSDGISDQHFSDTIKPLVPIASKATPAPKPAGTDTVWDSIFFATEITGNSWSMDSDEVDYRYINAMEHDSSSGGYCLEFRSGELRSLDPGELLGLRAHPGATMQLCQVRWIEQHQDRLLAGVMLLAAEIEPILAIMAADQQQTPLAALLGIGQDGHPQLFLPNLPGLERRQLSLVVDRYEVPIELQQHQAVSPLFIACRFVLHPALQHRQVLDQNMSLDELNRRLHQLTSDKPAVPQPGSDDFSDLWSTL